MLNYFDVKTAAPEDITAAVLIELADNMASAAVGGLTQHGFDLFLTARRQFGYAVDLLYSVEDQPGRIKGSVRTPKLSVDLS